MQQEDILYYISIAKLTHVLINGISIFNLAVVAKMEEMAAVPDMEEGQA